MYAPTLRFILLFSVAVQASCSLDDTNSDSDSWSSPYIHTVVPWVPSASGHWFLVDTGSPRTQVLPQVAKQADDFSSEEEGLELDLVGLYEGEALLVSGELPPLLLAAVESSEVIGLGGILGADLLEKYPFALEPSTESIHFGGQAKTLLDRGESVPVERLGGGRFCLNEGLCYEAGPSRLIAPIELGDLPIDALVDTAATYVTIPQILLDTLLADDPSIPVSVVQEQDHSWRIAKVKMRWGNVEREVAVRAGDGMGPSLARLHLESGRRVQALLGHSFFEAFTLAIDYAGPDISLIERPRGEVPIHFQGVGLYVSPGDECFQPELVALAAPAGLVGIDIHSCVESIDGIGPNDPGAFSAAKKLASLPLGAMVQLRWSSPAASTPIVSDLESVAWLGAP